MSRSSSTPSARLIRGPESRWRYRRVLVWARSAPRRECYGLRGYRVSGDEVEPVEFRHDLFSLDQGVSDDRQQQGDPQSCDDVIEREPISLAPIGRRVLGPGNSLAGIAPLLPHQFGPAFLECAGPSAAMASLERGEQRRCSGCTRGALDFTGAYVTPPDDINAFPLA